MALIAKIFDIDTIDDATRSLRVRASTKTIVENVEWDHDKDEPVEFLELLESWDLSRFSDNPIVLFQHNQYDDPIGLAQDIQETDDGLEMTVVFASPAANPEIDKLWSQVKQGLLRKVSVGFDYGERTDEERDGRTVRVYRNNELMEVSLVRIPKDAGAGVLRGRRAVEVQPDGSIKETGRPPGRSKREELSSAGKQLASARRSDANEDTEVVQRFDVYGTMGRVQQTSSGGIRVPARLTRTGVLEYKQADGTIRRELRLPEEVFHADALESLRSAPVTDITHHNGFIVPQNWKQAALGHAENIRVDGDFVEGELVINEPKAIAEVLNGNLREISLGYGCRIEAKAGTYNGKRYDFVQRRIRNNHVAVLPPGRARAGSDVSIRLDSLEATDAVCVGGSIDMKLIKIGNREVEYGSEEHIGILTNETKELKERFDAREKEHADEVAKLKKEKDETQARFDALETEKKGVEQKLEEATKPEAIAEKVRNRVALVSVARDAIGSDDETTKRFDAMSDRELMVEVIKSQVDGFDPNEKSDDYVRARFDALDVQRFDGVDSVVRAGEAAKKRGAEQTDEAKARAEQRERDAKRWQQPVGISK